MYKVLFEGKDFASVQDIETACALALSVHRSSNLPHVVEVRKHSIVVDVWDVIISFKLSPDAAERLNKKG